MKYEQLTIEQWAELAEDELIIAHVPEADVLTREEALALARGRDAQEAMEFIGSANDE